MKIVISPTIKSNTDFNLSLTSKYFELELQDWHFAYSENAEDLRLRFEPDDSIQNVNKENVMPTDFESQDSFIELSKHQGFVFALR
ncbi:MAG: hypothetical protein CVU42_00480 [Chloroflexi bacterium HGW-Chloroflexi-4]|jgi:hypothetical protein|nr:MAG: hypothetical protein CVU46_17735 [Chloroflexi bacterium HGW-Chloroflexi-8]PKO01317.1 MAG: hypothetical protein CVU42_00480 [Chloroflexi bacterium HGW-Chloroflexi-4]